MRSRRTVAVLVILAALAGVGVTVWRQRASSPAPRDARPAAHGMVLQYLYALQERDRGGILKLVPADYDAAKDVDDRLQRFGGATASGADIRITQDLSPEVLSATIRTRGADGRQLVWTENLFWRDGAWWLVLGGRPRLLPASDIQRPDP